MARFCEGLGLVAEPNPATIMTLKATHQSEDH